MNFKQCTTLLWGSLFLLGTGSALAAVPFLVESDTPQLIMSQDNEFLEVDFIITNNYKQLGSRDELTVSHLPENVFPLRSWEEDDNSDAFCQFIGDDEEEHTFKIEPMGLGESCMLRLGFERERNANDAGVSTVINPKICANDMVCNNPAGNPNRITVTVEADLEHAPNAPDNIALVENSRITFKVEIENDVSPQSPEMEFIIPEIYQDLVRVILDGDGDDDGSEKCGQDSDGDLTCIIVLEVLDEDFYTQLAEDDDIRSPAVAIARLVSDSGGGDPDTRISGDTTIKLWWDAVELEVGDEQHLQYQSLEFAQDDDYPGEVHLECANAFIKRAIQSEQAPQPTIGCKGSEGGELQLLVESPVVFCDYDDPTCRYHTTCELEENIGDDTCKLWFQALEPASPPPIPKAQSQEPLHPFGSADFTIVVDMGEDYAEDEFEIIYEKTFDSVYNLSLYAGIIQETTFEPAIFRYDGFSWNEIFFGPEGTVSALVNWEGDLIAGGNFSNECSEKSCKKDEFFPNNIARWDGYRWHALGDGPLNGTSGPVYALADNDESLYVGGSFTHAGNDVLVNNIATWNGEDWESLPSVRNEPKAIVTPGTDGPVYAILVPEPALFNASACFLNIFDGVYVGGDFDLIESSLLVNNIAIWHSGSNFWSDLSGGGVCQGACPPKDIGQVNALANDACNLYVGGIFDRVSVTSGLKTAHNVAGWNGAWFNIGSPTNGVSCSPTNTSACGPSTSPNGRVNALIWDDLNAGLYVGGNFDTVDTTPSTLPVSNIAYFNGGWHQLQNGQTGPSRTFPGFGSVNAFAEVFNPTLPGNGDESIYFGGDFNLINLDYPTDTITAENVGTFNFPHGFGPVKGPNDYGINDGVVESLLVMPGLHIFSDEFKKK